LLEAEKKVRAANIAVARLSTAVTKTVDLMIQRTLWKWMQKGKSPIDLGSFAKHWRYALPIMAYILSELTSNSPFSKAPIGRGRPSGTSGDWPLRSFIQSLYRLADNFGCHFAFDRNKDSRQVGQGNSLGRALHLLRPALPPDFIPNELPYSTIEDIVAEYHARVGRPRQ
jgi:hypothetical protein